ncbi:MAG: nitroreductase [Thermodesulfobacteriota bacterium]
MELDLAINRRGSIRAFLDKPVDRTVIEEILALAVRSPSWGNTQPWEIVVAGGEKTIALTDEFTRLLKSGVPSNPDFAMPDKFEGDYNDRYKSLGREVFRLKGIGREDQEARFNHYLRNFKAFGASNLVYILIDQSLKTVYHVFDAGLLAAHICLLATSRGLGTCLLAALAWYPDAIRKHLEIGPEKKVVIGLALGHPDPDAPVNQLRSQREPIEKTVRWVGLDRKPGS